ncbi:hypothetical protein HNR44_001765 [Geomicrobium halophilum]|uniref:Uncharacterized protein n=1 Tax=Geomicrobium halophilum TaxID=549000 RepID=A0A841PLQ6_9BACL|nr:hypothetical protein [Geomicrobium halophilum]MBB6449787.1 hypothetical protein [Geomicrobium halophilum]
MSSTQNYKTPYERTQNIIDLHFHYNDDDSPEISDEEPIIHRLLIGTKQIGVNDFIL